MSREDDWKIHTLMGNDLTGWELAPDMLGVQINRAFKRLPNGFIKAMGFPHYSTTWEGAGLVMEWLNVHRKYFVIRHLAFGEYGVEIEGSDDEKLKYADTLPLALAKAYISAMEER